MCSGQGATSRVLVWRDSIESTRTGLRHLWEKIERYGWLTPISRRVAIQIGPAWRDELVEETARSLIDFLRERHPTLEIMVVGSGSALTWGTQGLAEGMTWLPYSTEERITLSSPCMPKGIPVPTLWLDSFFLITISGAGPDPLGRLSGILQAQAASLPRNEWEARLYYDEMIYEAHRLAASDLGIVCGPVSRQRPQASAFWAASCNDIALELALARAAGLQPQDVPHLRFLEKHELISHDHVELEGEWPQLEGYVESVWQVRMTRLWWGVIRKRWTVLGFVKTTQYNLRRLRMYLQKRLSRRGKG